MKIVLWFYVLSAALPLRGQKNEFGWLLGTWQDENKMSFEVWIDQGHFFSGSAYSVDQAGRKTLTEEIRLIRKGNDFYYVPDVAGPQGPVAFKITSLDHNSFIAENPDHDFPQRITYQNVDARLEATVSGGSRLIRYHYRKIK